MSDYNNSMPSTSKSFDYEPKIAKVRCTMSLDKYHIKNIDKIKNALGLDSRSAVLRRILDQYLNDYAKLVHTWNVITPEQIRSLGL